MARLLQILLSNLIFIACLHFSTCHTDEQKENAAKNRVWTLEIANSVRRFDPSFGVHNQKHKSFRGDEIRLYQPTGYLEYDLFKGVIDYYEKQKAKPGDEAEPEEVPKKRKIKLPAVFTTKVLNPKTVDCKDFIALIAAFGHTYLDAGIWNWLNKEAKVSYKFLTKKGYTIEGGSGKKEERKGDRKELNSADIEVLKEMLDKAKEFIKDESMILGLPVENEKKEEEFLSEDLLTEGLTSSSVEMDKNDVLEPSKIYPNLSPAVRFPNYNISPKITKDKEKHNKEKMALLVKSLYLLDLGLYLSRRAMNPDEQKKTLPQKVTVANPTVENPTEFFVYVEINELIKKIRDLDPKQENKEVWGRLCVYDRDHPNANQLKQSVEITIPEMLRTRKIKTGEELVDAMHMIVNPLRLHTLRDWITPAIRYERYAKKALNFLKENKYTLTGGAKWQTILQQAKTIVEKQIEITEEEQAVSNKNLHMTPIGNEKHNKTYELLLKITALFFKEQRHGAAESGSMPEIYFGELQDAYGEFLGHSYFKKLSKVMRKLRGARDYLRKTRQVDRWLLGEYKWLEKYVNKRIGDKSTIREPIITEIEDELQADDYGTPKENKDAVRLAKLMIMVKDVLILNKATVVDLYPDQLDLFTSAIYIYAESYKDYQTKKKKGAQSRSAVRSLSHTDNSHDQDDPYHHLKSVGESIIGVKLYSLIESQCRAFYSTLDEKFGHDDVIGLLIAKEILNLLSKPLLNWHKYVMSCGENKKSEIIMGPDGKPAFGKLLITKENAFGHIEWDLGENIDERMEATEDLLTDLLATHNIKFDDEEDFDEHERLIWHSVCNFSFGMLKGSYDKVGDADKLYGVLHARVLGLVIEDRPFQGRGGNLQGQANDMFREWLGALLHYPKILTEKVKVYLMAKNVELTDPTLLSERGLKKFEERYAKAGETQMFKTVFKNQRNEGIITTVMNCSIRMKKKEKNNEDAHTIDTFHQKLLIASARMIKEARKKAGGKRKSLQLIGVDVINDTMDSVEPFMDHTRAEGLYSYHRYYDEHTKKKSRKAFHKEQLAFVTKVEKLKTWKGIDALSAMLKGSRRSGIKRNDFDQITLFLLAKDELDMEFKQSFMVTLYQLKDIAAIVEEYVKRIKDKINDVHSHESAFQDFRGKLAKTIASSIIDAKQDSKDSHEVTQQQLKSAFSGPFLDEAITRLTTFYTELYGHDLVKNKINHLLVKEVMDTVLDAVEKIWEFDAPPEFDGTYPIDTFEHVVDYGRAEMKRYLQQVSNSMIALVEGNEEWHKNNGREGTLANPEIKYLPLNFKFSIMHFGLY